MQQETEEWQPGERIGAYEVVRAVGNGGMAVVFEVRHTELGGRAALKVLRGDKGSPVLRERFLREGKTAARIHHPHVVRVIDVGEHRGAAWLLMEFIEGQSLRTRLQRAPPLPVEQALDLVLPVIAAVSAAHDAGVIHRDLKPANIMLERLRDGGTRPVVVDFGIARMEGPDGGRALTQQGAIVGTPAYLAPEQVQRDGASSPACDQWSTAAVLYECVCGRKAFPGSNVLEVLGRVARGAFDPPRALRPELPAAFESVILTAMALDPARRFRSMRAFGRALLPFASDRTRILWERSFVSDDDVTGVHTVSAPPSIDPVPEAPAATPLASVSPVPPLRAPSPPASTHSIARPIAVTAAGMALMALSAAVALRRAPQKTFRAAVEVASPVTATVVVDGQTVAGPRFDLTFTADGRAHELWVTAPRCIPHVETFVDTPPTSRIELRCGPGGDAPRPPSSPPPLVVAVPSPDAAPSPSPTPSRPRRSVRHTDPRRASSPTTAPEGPPDPAPTLGRNNTPNL